MSAIAPMTESDCALIDFASKHTDLVVGVVSKIDAHRNWRDVLAADRTLLTQRAPRYAQSAMGRRRRLRPIWASLAWTSSSVCCGNGWRIPM